MLFSNGCSASVLLIGSFADRTFPAQGFAQDGYLEDENASGGSAALKEDIVGSDRHMAIYGEKKAGANELLRVDGVTLIQVSARAYNTSKGSNELGKQRVRRVFHLS